MQQYILQKYFTLTIYVKELVMGAYFSTQIFEPSNSKEVVAEFSHGNVPFLNHYAGLKFLESFFFFTRANMLAYFYLFLVSNQDHPLVFSTVCDYDEDENGNSKNLDWGRPDLLGDIGLQFVPEDIKDKLKYYAQQIMKSNKKEDNFFFEYLLNNPYYIVCGDEYIDLQYFVNEQKKYFDEKNNASSALLCPLAILTRRSKERQGGGDMYESMLEQVGDYVTRWFGREIYATTEKPTDKTDISSHVVVLEEW